MEITRIIPVNKCPNCNGRVESKGTSIRPFLNIKTPFRRQCIKCGLNLYSENKEQWLYWKKGKVISETLMEFV